MYPNLFEWTIYTWILQIEWFKLPTHVWRFRMHQLQVSLLIFRDNFRDNFGETFGETFWETFWTIYTWMLQIEQFKLPTHVRRFRMYQLRVSIFRIKIVIIKDNLSRVYIHIENELYIRQCFSLASVLLIRREALPSSFNWVENILFAGNIFFVFLTQNGWSFITRNWKFLLYTKIFLYFCPRSLKWSNQKRKATYHIRW